MPRLPRRQPKNVCQEGRYPIERSSFKWVGWPESGPSFPDGMVCGGKLDTGEMAFISRAVIGDQMAAGFMVKASGTMHAAYGCREHTLSNFEIVVVENEEAVEWKRCSNGRPPTNTCCDPLIVGGGYGERMLVGRTCTPLTEGRTYQGNMLQLSRFALTGDGIHRPGKIHQSHNCLYVPHAGREYIFDDHEMLMLKGTPGSLKDVCCWSILKHLRVTMHKIKDIDRLPLPKAMKDCLTTANSVN